MSECIAQAADYKGNQQTVVGTKKAIVVSFFFAYIIYVVALAGKHCLDKKSKNETVIKWQKKAELF